MFSGFGYYDAFLGLVFLYGMQLHARWQIATAAKGKTNVKIPWTVDVPTIHAPCVVRFHTAATGG